MAKEVVTRCDKCGQSGDDVKTYTVRVDGKSAEVDLDDEHVSTVSIAEAFSLGRLLSSGARGGTSANALEKRIRNAPQPD